MIREEIKKIIDKVLAELNLDTEKADFKIEKPNSDLGDYSCNAAFLVAKQLKKSPKEIAEMLVSEIEKNKPEKIERVEIAGGYINFFLSPAYLQKELSKIAENKNFGFNKNLAGKTVMVEYTDPNAFKPLHIGHMMSNTIGESLARIFESSGAKVIRACYPSDIGLNIAKAVWGVLKNKENYPDSEATLSDKVAFLGKAYVSGTQAYEESETGKKEIEEINKKLFDKSDSELTKLYLEGRQWSLDYFEEIYKRLGTKFDVYFFESDMAAGGKEIVLDNPNIFKKSDGAIVFKGEDHGLHTRVFITSKDLPTYEAKEIQLNKEKFKSYPLDLSVIITANEQDEYFKVVLKAIELIYPDIASKTVHISHGMLRLPTGKMSSRTGDVITAEWLIDETKSRLKERDKKENNFSAAEKETNSEQVAIGAIKYSILKQSPGHDIIFDFDKSLSLEGDSGPYAQYAYARLNSILAKASDYNPELADITTLKEVPEFNLVKQLIEFPEVVKESSENLAPHRLVQYIYKLSSLANNFYESIRILTDDDSPRKQARLILIKTVASVLETGLGLLGIEVMGRI